MAVSAEPAPVEALLSGQVIQNSHGQYFKLIRPYPLHQTHGHSPLSHFKQISRKTIATITADASWLDLAWEDILFIDTETTGLDTSAGTHAFLIGVGYVDAPNFVVEQYFMRDFDEENALLQDLHGLCQRFTALVSFNGKTFDVPLLENRFTLARAFIDLADWPHFDLLHPSRRMWRRRLDNCKLSTLEAEILGVERTQQDVPGFLIPSLYRHYLQGGDARPLAGIFYHNELDIASMAALVGVLGQYVESAVQVKTALPQIDQFSLGLWLEHLGQTEPAEAILKDFIEQCSVSETRTLALTKLAYLLKRQQRYQEAESYWQELVLGPDKLLALEELAKHYEWRTKDFTKALKCVDYGLKTIAAWREGVEKQAAWAVWTHRQTRVQAKISLKD